MAATPSHPVRRVALAALVGQPRCSPLPARARRPLVHVDGDWPLFEPLLAPTGGLALELRRQPHLPLRARGATGVSEARTACSQFMTKATHTHDVEAYHPLSRPLRMLTTATGSRALRFDHDVTSPPIASPLHRRPPCERSSADSSRRSRALRRSAPSSLPPPARTTIGTFRPTSSPARRWVR